MDNLRPKQAQCAPGAPRSSAEAATFSTDSRTEQQRDGQKSIKGGVVPGSANIFIQWRSFSYFGLTKNRPVFNRKTEGYVVFEIGN